MKDLTSKEILSIEQKAKDILLSVYESKEAISVPIDISKITDKYGFKVKRGKFKNPDISGEYIKKSKEILVTTDDIYERQIFTVAHELGHYFLHNEKDQETFNRNQFTEIDSADSKPEAESNWFAAALLMPEEIIKKYFKESVKISQSSKINDLSKIFGVSHTAAYFRLKNLNLI